MNSEIEFSFHLNEEEFKRKWEEQWESVRKSLNVSDKNVTLEGKYWDQLEQWLLRNYENQFKNLSIEVAKVRFSRDIYIQQMEFSLNEHLKSWPKHLDKLVKDKVNVEISKKINQQINQHIDLTFEQRIRNNIGLIINNLVNKQELNQYIDQQVNQQVDQTFEQKIQNNISLITQDIVNNTELTQYFSQQIGNSFEQNLQNHIHVMTQNIVNDNDVLNQYFEQRLQLAVTNNTEINNKIVNIVTNSAEINNKIENIRNEWNENFISLV